MAAASRNFPSEEMIDEATLMSLSFSSVSRSTSNPSSLRRSPRRFTSARRTPASGCDRNRCTIAGTVASPILTSASVAEFRRPAFSGSPSASSRRSMTSPRGSRTKPSTIVLRTRQSLSPRSSNMSGKSPASLECDTRYAAFWRMSGSAERACWISSGLALIFVNQLSVFGSFSVVPALDN